MCDPEYQVDLQIYENLWWMLKVKSDLHWQKPMHEFVHDMREACTQEIQSVIVKRKADLGRLANGMNEQYLLREGADLGEFDDRVKIKKMARLLPLGVMKGKNLKLTVYLEKLEETKLPAEFVFGHAKGDITHQKVEYMQHKHMDGMKAAGQHITWVIDSINQLFEEVREDLKMSGSLETKMMHPPNLSQLYLPFCEGREVLRDARTPRSSQHDDSTDETVSPHGSPRSPTTPGSPGRVSKRSAINAAGEAVKFNKIERNSVLTVTSTLARQNSNLGGKLQTSKKRKG
jgi:hypothetical protein